MATQAAVGIQLNEANLIRAGQRGDQQAVEALFRRYQRPLFQTALRVLGNTEDAEDALQDGLLSAYRNLKRFEGRSQFSTWLTRIVINAALMRRRSAKARPAVSLDETPREDELPASERFADDGPNPEQVFAGTELREMISENLDELSPLLRTAFVLREVQGYSTGEAAKKLGVTENTLKARLWRARHIRPSFVGPTGGPAPSETRRGSGRGRGVRWWRSGLRRGRHRDGRVSGLRRR